MGAKYRFGAYELDVAERDLRKNGSRVRLQEQPLRILTALVKKPGQLVTREDLKQRIWGNDTYVDFDQSINKAVNRLREVLNDNASHPRYIETVPRQGYRFVAYVTDANTSGELQQATVPTETSYPHGRRRIFLTSAVITALISLAWLASVRRGHA